jgi:hypothetical protein
LNHTLVLNEMGGETVTETLPAGVYIVTLEGRRYKVAIK